MACACNAKSGKFPVVYSNGSAYKTYSTAMEAAAAAKRIGGKVLPQK
jgi:hypothetical protein